MDNLENELENTEEGNYVKRIVYEGEEEYEKIPGCAFLAFKDNKIVCYKNKYEPIEEKK